MKAQDETVSQMIETEEKYAADLDQALAVAGLGWYNLKYILVLSILLIAAIVEFLSYSVVLPAAACDLNLSDGERGFIASIPYIGILVTSYPWGYLIDTKGRKKTVIYSSLAAGFFSLLSSFMPDMYSFAVFKLLTAFCVACPSTVPFTFIGEILPGKSRDFMLSTVNALQIVGSAIVPLLGWAIIPLDFRINFGIYDFRSWRLLSIIFSLLPVIASIMMLSSPESPKYLVSQGQYNEALKVLQNMYAGNKKKRPEDYPITKLIAPPDDREKGNFLTSLKAQTMPLLKWTYLKWLLLNGFLFFGMFSVLNGLYIWVPDVLNRVMTGSGTGKTACEVITDRFNQTSIVNEMCDDSIDKIALIINSIAQVSCAIIAFIISVSVNFIGKKNLLVASFFIIGAFNILINFIRNEKIFAVLMSTFPLLVLAMGPVNAYAVEIFPTHLRGMAMSLALMLGRLGSITGSNVTGLLINTSCENMFYFFGVLLLICSALSFLLRAPNTRQSSKREQKDITRL